MFYPGDICIIDPANQVLKQDENGIVFVVILKKLFLSNKYRCIIMDKDDGSLKKDIILVPKRYLVPTRGNAIVIRNPPQIEKVDKSEVNNSPYEDGIIPTFSEKDSEILGAIIEVIEYGEQNEYTPKAIADIKIIKSKIDYYINKTKSVKRI